MRWINRQRKERYPDGGKPSGYQMIRDGRFISPRAREDIRDFIIPHTSRLPENRTRHLSTIVVIQCLRGQCVNGYATTLVRIMFGAGLMPAPPVRPGQDVVRRLRHGQDHAPEEPANLLDAQRHARPCPALKAARRPPRGGAGRRFLNASTAIAPARRTVRSAWAHLTRVICRYHPVQLRTSS